MACDINEVDECAVAHMTFLGMVAVPAPSAAVLKMPGTTPRVQLALFVQSESLPPPLQVIVVSAGKM